jgi:hypothetical protein
VSTRHAPHDLHDLLGRVSSSRNPSAPARRAHIDALAGYELVANLVVAVVGAVVPVAASQVRKA